MTLPKPIRHIAKLNRNLIYHTLFEQSSKVLQDWFSYKHGIVPGIVSVLHTSGSDLKDHPHVHMIVTGGGLDQKTMKPKKLKGYYLTRQRYLADKLRKRFVGRLKSLQKQNKLKLPKRWIDEPIKFSNWLEGISEKQWIVSIQKPLEDLSQIVGYVGRYTKRACISEYKIVSIKDDYISFKYKDYKNSKRGEPPKESIRRMHYVNFLDELMQHVPNKSFRMVRYYGCYASHYKKYLPEVKVEVQQESEVELDHSWGEYEELRKKDISKGKPDPLSCPHCKKALEFESLIFTKSILYDDG